MGRRREDSVGVQLDNGMTCGLRTGNTTRKKWIPEIARVLRNDGDGPAERVNGVQIG
jgi:hypothetical protein